MLCRPVFHVPLGRNLYSSLILLRQAVPEVVRQVLESQLTSILAGHSVDAFHDAYAAQYGSVSLRHRAAAAEAGAALRPQEKAAVTKWLLDGEGPVGAYATDAVMRN